MAIVCVSGGLDPIHDGHLAMINEASAYGDVVVILNSDEWLIRKKGFVFLSWDVRAAIIGNFRNVKAVVGVDDSDGTVCEALRRIKPDYFANGGDRKIENTPENSVCDELNIKQLWNIGGGKENSSSEIAKRAIVQRKWGSYLTLDEGLNYKVKRLVIDSGCSISLQKHLHRTETWTVVSGEATVRIGNDVLTKKVNQTVFVDKDTVHQITNEIDHPLVIIETQVGDKLTEDDIIRYS